MSSAIEERIVSMQFKGEQFLAGVEKSLSALDKLNSKLKLQEGAKGLTDVGSAAEGQAGKLSKIADAVESIGGKFKSMGVIALSALSTVTTQAVLAGENLVKSITFKPLTDGFHEYETNLNAIQTILANTASAGTNLNQVNAALNELNHYSDQTIYNFAEMAKNIGTFTAAGVALKPAVQAIKGIANLAALSGSNSEQASTAMYQLSQAISAGRVSLEDWNSVVNAGMGGTVFQRALANTAEKMGTLSKGAVKLTGDMKNVTIGGKSFRDSITAKPGEKSWLTSDVLTKTLAQFTGDLTDAQLKAEGFNASEIKAIQTQAKLAKNAATQVKTFSQLLSTTSEAVGSGWSSTWQIIFGDFGEAKTLFTNISNTVNGFVNASANARNKVLADWKALGGRKAIIDGLALAFNDLMEVVTPIGKAFRDIFPAITGKQLADFSKSFKEFFSNARLGEDTMNNLRRTFRGVFAVLDIGWQIVKKIGKTLLDLIGVATKGSSGFLNFTGNIGDFLVRLDQAIKSGKGLTDFFAGLEKFLAGPIELVKKLGSYFLHLFDGFNGSSAADKVISSLTLLSKLGNGIGSVWGKLGAILTGVWKVFEPIAKKIGSFFANLGHAVASALSGINYEDFLKTINTGLFAGLLLMLKNLIDKFKKGSGGAGLFDTIKESFEALTGALENMQKVLQATALLEIAAAVGILTISLVALSKLDIKQLSTSLGAIAVMFGELIGTMAVLQKFITGAGAIKLPLIAAGFIILAAAVDILAIAVKQLAGLDWNGLAKGLTGVLVILGGLTAAAHLMPDGKKMISSSLGLIAMAAAVKILASAVANLSGMSWEELAKGLTGVGAVLLALGLFTRFAEADKGGLLSGAGLLLLATGIKILAGALSDMSKLSWGDIIKGLVTLGASLAIVTAAIDGMEASLPGVLAIAVTAGALVLIAKALDQMGQMSWSEIAKSLVELTGALVLLSAGMLAMEEGLPGAAALVVAAASLVILADALGKMGDMSWSEIGKSMVVLAGSMVILALALAGMEEALPGAAALVVAAAALAILAPVMVVLGGLSWESIAKGLVALAGALTVIGVAGALLSEITPAIIALGAGVALLGAAMALAGVGVAAFGVGLTLIAASGAAAAGALVAIVTTLLGAVPTIVDLIGKLLVSILNLVIQVAPKLGQAFTVLLMTFLTSIDTVGPKLVNTFLHLLSELIDALLKYVPHMVDAGTRLLVALLNGIAKSAPRLVTAGTNAIVSFINAINANQGRVIDAGVKMIIGFVNGLANSIRAHTGEMQAAGRNLAFAIIDGMTGGLASGVGRVIGMARSVAESALAAAKSALGIHSPSKEFEKVGNYVNDGFVKGLKGNQGQVDNAFNSLKKQLSDLMKSSGDDIDTLTAKLKKLEHARHKDYDAINKTKAALAEARKEHAESSKAYSTLTKNLNDEHSALDKLASKYNAVSTQLQAAQQKLADAKKTRDDFNASVKDQYDNLPDISNETHLSDFTDSLKKEIEDTQTFANTLQALRKAGLSDALYKQLLAKGTSALPFAQELLAGGKGQIDQLNQLSKDLDTVAAGLGKTASSDLYDAAVNAAAGLVKGLQDQQAAIQKQMDQIAAAMVKAIKKALGIKSPSTVFAEIGGYAVQGLVSGLQNTTAVQKSAADMGQTAINSLSKSLTGINDLVTSTVTTDPVIKPVLDLTDIQNGAKQIGNIFTTMPISVGSSLNNANNASDGYLNNSTLADLAQSQLQARVNYTQNNYSPKPLNPAEIYRQTRNQLSKTKVVSAS